MRHLQTQRSREFNPAKSTESAMPEQDRESSTMYPAHAQKAEKTQCCGCECRRASRWVVLGRCPEAIRTASSPKSILDSAIRFLHHGRHCELDGKSRGTSLSVEEISRLQRQVEAGRRVQIESYLARRPTGANACLFATTACSATIYYGGDCPRSAARRITRAPSRWSEA